MATQPEKILVLGAGELGTPILRELSNPKWGPSDITLLLRSSSLTSSDREKQAQLDEFKSLGIKFLPGDLATGTVDELAELFKEFHTVIGATGYVAGPGTQIKLARAALQAGVKRYFPWQFGVDYDTIGRGSGQDLFDEQLDVRDLLRSQTQTEWVIISTGVFMSYLFSSFFGVVDIEHNAIHALGSLDNRITVSTVEDIGRLTAEIVYSQPRLANTVVYIASDTLSYGQVADIVDEVFQSRRDGRKITREIWDVPSLQIRLEQNPDDTLAKYSYAFSKGVGVAWDVNQTFNGQRGIPVTNARQWASQHLQV